MADLEPMADRWVPLSGLSDGIFPPTDAPRGLPVCIERGVPVGSDLPRRVVATHKPSVNSCFILSPLQYEVKS